ERDELHHAKSPAYSLTAQPETMKAASSHSSNGQDEGPGLLERFKETSAYDRLSKEVGSLGDRVVEDLSTTAHQVVLPLLLNKIKGWVGLDLSEKTPSMAPNPERLAPSYQPPQPATGRSSEF
ncbi:MAG TPA: hypothetical protein VGC61_05950, partial [Pyrinomonadaceae bacterium]